MSFSNSLSSEISRNEYIWILFFCVKVSNSEINLSIIVIVIVIVITVISIQFDHGTQKFILIITPSPIPLFIYGSQTHSKVKLFR